VRVQVLPATPDQLVMTYSGEPRDLLTVRAREWFARVAAPRRRLADQPDLVRLDLLLSFYTNISLFLSLIIRKIELTRCD
jgi:hypothetical protein